MANFIIDADGHIMEDHKDIFAHIKGNFGEMNWHSTWPMFDADGWQRGLARKGKREDPDAERWIKFQDENGVDMAVWTPATDPLLPARYSAANLAGKQVCRAELLKRCNFAPGYQVPPSLTSGAAITLSSPLSTPKRATKSAGAPMSASPCPSL